MSNYSDFWDTRKSTLVDDILSDTEVKTKPKKDHMALAGHKRAIGNFVRIVSGQNIPVKFADRGDSYTDGKKVVISSTINERTFDETVGLALHEGSHIAFSDFNIFAEVRNWHEIGGFELTPERMTFLRNMINYIEDRRVDSIVFKSSPGYKGYYHSMYAKYFNHKTITKGLNSNMYREIDLDSYLFRIINFTNDATDLTALPKLEEVYNLIDIKNISRLKSTGGAIEVAHQVCEILFPMIDKVAAEQQEQEQGDGEESEDQDGEGQDTQSQAGAGGDEQDTDAGDTQPDTSSLPQLNAKVKKQLENLLNKEKDLLNGKTQKSKMTKSDAKIVDTVSRSGAELKDVEMDSAWGRTKTKVILVPKLTQEMIDNGVFSFTNKWAQTFDRSITPINEGLRLGTILGKKLKVRGEERDLIHTRQKSGKIDKRLISELGFDNGNVFSHKFTERYNKANLHISVDGSSSMNGRKWDKAITSTIAMCKAAEMAGNIKVVVSFRYTQDKQPVVLIAYDSSKDKIQKIKSLWPALTVAGTTPESLCYDAMMTNFLQISNSDDNYFINYSDGSPWFSNDDAYYYGDNAANHCRKIIKGMRNNGVKILSYFIADNTYGSEKKWFEKMYGDDASFINPSNMMEVAKTMNKMFLSK